MIREEDKMKIIRFTAVIVITAFLLTGCTFKSATGTPSPSATATGDLLNQIATLTGEKDTLQKQVDSLSKNKYLAQAMIILDLLKNKDTVGLAAYADPVKGFRFSPYASVSTTSDKSFAAADVAKLGSSATSYAWGHFDGSGLPIEGNFTYYYSQFVYDADYENPQEIGINTAIGTGNTPNNIADVYPDAVFIEFHFNGFDAAAAGMDWKSLRLVFEKSGSTIYLVGIVHAQWTI